MKRLTLVCVLILYLMSADGLAEKQTVEWFSRSGKLFRPLVEQTENFHVIHSDESPLRLLKLLDGNGQYWIRITMRETNRVFVSCGFPPFTYLDTYHDENGILVCVPMESPEDASFDDVDLADYLFLTYEYSNEVWRLTSASNGQTWIAVVSDREFTFNDYYCPDNEWEWKTEGKDRLEEADYKYIWGLGEEYNQRFPDRPAVRFLRDDLSNH